MNKKKKLFNCSFFYVEAVNQYGFEYGNLANLHPSETFTQLKTRRESNFSILKTLSEAGTDVNIGYNQLEVSIISGQKIQTSILNLSGANRNSSTIVVWPFVPRTGVTAGTLIEPRYGDTHNLSNITIKSPVKNNFHETYSCILKPGGATNQIQILGTVRDDFWAEMIPGKTVFYGWTFSVLGETKVISSADEGTGIITLTTNISGSVASNTQGATVNFGTSFKEDISQEDYLNHGRAWVLNNFESNRLLYGVPAAGTGTDYTLNCDNVIFENTANQVLVSMGNFKVNLNETTFKKANSGLSLFTRNTAGGQTLTSTGTLLVEEVGDLVAGAVALLEPSGNYGAGGYIHDNCIVKCNGTLHLKNNTSASWRQYSSSYSPANPGFNYYANIIEEGSVEYGFLMSNTVPTTIENITSTGSILPRHDTTINGGNMLYISNHGTDFGLGSRHIEINDTTLRGVASFNLFTTGELNNCTFEIPEFSTLQLMVTPSIGTFNINGGRIENSGNVGTWNRSTGATTGNRGSNFCSFKNVIIDSLEWDSDLYHYLFTTGVTQTPYTEKDFRSEVNNTDVVCYSIAVDGLSAAGGISGTLSGTNTSGKFKDMTRGGRIAYGAASELLPKVAVAALLGVPLMQILGMRDFTGATSGDFTGIEEDEKTFLDEVVTALSISPAMGVGGKFYFANRRNQEADQLAAKGEEYGAERRAEDKPLAVAQDAAMTVVPFYTQFKKTRDMAESVDRGSFENRDGRVQSETPTSGAEILTGLIAGKNYTQKMREYMDNPNAVTVLKGKAKPQDLLTHNETVSNVAQAIKLKNPRDYHRPLSASIKNKDGTIAVKGYSDMAKDAHAAAVKKHGVNSKQAREVLSEWTANGREYNRVTDDLKKKDPAAYETWIKAKDDDVLTPEKWRIYNGNRNVFAFEKKRKALEKRDLGRAIDPIYELPDNHANEILQERSSYTGEDMKLRALLWKKDWYADKFKVAEAKYFESFDGKRDDSSKGARVQEWNKLSEAAFSPKTGVITKYPLVAQYEAEVDKFDNYNSQERKDFTKSWYNNHGEAYTKQKEDYDNERFNLVNKMRKIENVGELTFDDFKAKVEFPSETAEKNSWAKGSKGGRGGGGGGGGGSKSFDPNKYRISLSTGKMDVSGKVNAAPVRAKVKRRVIAKPKVSMKKSAV